MIMFIVIPAATYVLGRTHPKKKVITPNRREWADRLAAKDCVQQHEMQVSDLQRKLAILLYATSNKIPIEEATMMYEVSRAMGRDLKDV